MILADELATAREHAASLPEAQREMAGMIVELARYHFAQPLLDKGRTQFEDLRAVCREMARVMPNSPLVFRTMAFCEARAGAYDDASNALRQFLRIDPGAGYDSRRELLRVEWLRAGSSAESRAEVTPIALARAGRLAQESYRLQSLYAGGGRGDLIALAALISRELRQCDAALLTKAMAGDPDAGIVNAILMRLRSAERIALVGNGSSVLGRKLGDEIEAHDCVVRFNFPRLSGFEADVGRRTDLMFIDNSHRYSVPTRVLREPEYPGLPVLVTSGGERGPSQDPPPGLPQDYINLGNTISYHRGTTGFRAIVMAILMFRRPVTLYGFDFFAPGEVGHYYERGTASVHHEVGYEAWFVRRFLPSVLPDLLRIN